MLINTISVILILAGMVFYLGGAVGMVRFPDFFTRMHAAGKGDTLSSLLLVSGLAVYHLHHVDPDDMGATVGAVLVAFKLLAVSLFIMLTSPTSTHALMDSGYEDGCDPMVIEGGNALDRESQRKDAGVTEGAEVGSRGHESGQGGVEEDIPGEGDSEEPESKR